MMDMSQQQNLDLDVNQIVQLHRDRTERWHQEETSLLSSAPWSEIERNHRMNFDLWHEEDMARRDDLGAERVRQAKRQIDRFNQARNNAMEQIDLWIQGQLHGMETEAVLHSETPGMIIDRLSILSLKRYHMAEEAQRDSASVEHRQRCQAKLKVIEEQLADLSQCLAWLIQQLKAGERRFKLYKQFKMYNDPNLNPQLYRPTPEHHEVI